MMFFDRKSWTTHTSFMQPCYLFHSMHCRPGTLIFPRDWGVLAAEYSVAYSPARCRFEDTLHLHWPPRRQHSAYHRRYRKCRAAEMRVQSHQSSFQMRMRWSLDSMMVWWLIILGKASFSLPRAVRVMTDRIFVFKPCFVILQILRPSTWSL